MTSAVENAKLLAAAGQAISCGFSAAEVPIPALLPEPAALRRPVAVIERGEPLAQVPAAGIDVLHSYLTAGWRHAVDRQWLRAGTLAQTEPVTGTTPSLVPLSSTAPRGTPPTPSTPPPSSTSTTTSSEHHAPG